MSLHLASIIENPWHIFAIKQPLIASLSIPQTSHR